MTTNPHQAAVESCPEAEDPSGSAECEEAEAGDDLSSACEVGAPFMLIDPVGNQAVPSRCREVGASKIDGGAAHDEPGPPLREQERQEQDGDPSEGLSYGADRDERFAIGEPLQKFD